MLSKKMDVNQTSFFFSLADTLNFKHPLYILVHRIDWQQFERAFSGHYFQDNGRPAKPIRLMFGLLILKHIRNISDYFQNKVTEIYYGVYITENAAPIKKMIFENVVWQEFAEFDFVNIFNIVEVGNSFEVFFNRHLSYFNTMKYYISEDYMGAMKLPNLFYYMFAKLVVLTALSLQKQK